MIKTLFYNRTAMVRINTDFWVIGFMKANHDFYNEIEFYFLCFYISIVILRKAVEIK